jgi:hypothetical protein
MWAWTTDLGAVGSVPVLITFHADGTIAGSDGFMFANPTAPPPGQGAKRGPLLGVWQRTGHHTFGGTSLWFQFNSAGVVTGYSRSRSADRPGCRVDSEPDHAARCVPGLGDQDPQDSAAPVGLLLPYPAPD